MKRIVIILEDSEHSKLSQIKDAKKLTWKQLLLSVGE